MNERLTEPVPVLPSWVISWNKWPRENLTRSWELSPTPRSQKETEMITSWTSSKSCHWTVFKRKKNVLSTGYRALEVVALLKRNPLQNYTVCAFKFLLQRQWKVSASTTKERKAFYHRFRRRELNFYTWSRLFSKFCIQNFLFLCHARMTVRHITSFCILNET